MSRRRSEFEFVLDELLGFFRKVPWWTGPVVALVVWIAFAFVLPWAVGLFAGEAKTLSHSVLVGVAGIVRMLAPFLGAFVVVVWLMALIKNYFEAGRLDRQSGIDSIRKLTWREFELLLAEAFKRQGYGVQETGPGPDGGIDLILQKDGQETIVQAKQWKAWSVGVKVIREFFGVKMSRESDEAIVVSSGRFTQEARWFAEENDVRLIDGEELEKLVCGVQKASKRPGGEAAESSDAGKKASGDEGTSCPVCATAMVKRIARRGPGTGQEFWGCPRFPECRGTRPA